jgi:hypothetical protein
MGFQFAETMSGTAEWLTQPGVHYPFSFAITVTAASTLAHLRNGRAELRGVVHAPPVAPAADAEGVITIRPIGQRIIRYQLEFAGPDDQRYALLGQKTIRWLAPTRSFTHLPAEILDDRGRRVATCETTFDLAHDWWRFVRSFRPR